MSCFSNRVWLRDLLILSSLLTVFYGIFLGARPFMSPDEGRYAEIAREMVVSHNYLVPHLDSVVYLEKPPLFYWLESAAIHIFGLHEWSLRLVTLFFSLFGCCLTYLATRKLYGRSQALLAGLVLITSPLYFAMAHFITLDMPVCVFLSGSLFAFILGTREPAGKRRNLYMWAMYIFAALATMTKGLIGIFFPGLIIFIWILLFNQWRNLKTYCLASGALLFLLIAAPWHILVQMQYPGFFHFYFFDQHFLRYFTSYAQREQPLWFLPICLIVGFFPWTAFLLQSFYYSLFHTQTRYAQHKETVFFILWVSLIFVFFLFSHAQLLTYLIPILPPLAILVGRYLVHAWRQQQFGGLRNGFFVSCAANLSLGLIGIWIVHHYAEKFAYLNAGIYLYISCSLLILTGMLSLMIYWFRNIRLALITLALCTLLTLISVNLSYSLTDTRSVKSLAAVLKPLLKPGDEVISYYTYYQDLPVYIQRDVIVVDWQGELAFGLQNQNNSSIFINDVILWQRWNSSQRIFMLMSWNDYQRLQKAKQGKIYLLAETVRTVLVSNQP